jgi:hypothetical protein
LGESILTHPRPQSPKERKSHDHERYLSCRLSRQQITTVAPLVIGIAGALRQPPPPRSEWIEVTGALVALALVTAVTILLPRGTWEILLPIAWSLPIVLWLAARSRPAFAAAGAFLVSISIVWTTIYGIGHFRGPWRFPELGMLRPWPPIAIIGVFATCRTLPTMPPPLCKAS